MHALSSSDLTPVWLPVWLPCGITLAKGLGTNVQGNHLVFVVNTALKDVNKYGWIQAYLVKEKELSLIA